MIKKKPKIEVLVKYFEDNIEGCYIGDAEIESLKSLYPKVSYRDLNRAFHEAVNKNAMQPISFMTRRLRIFKPESDPFNPQINAKRTEHGSDWDAVEAQFWKSKQAEEQAYDRQYGKGSWNQKEKNNFNKLHNFFVKLELESDKSVQKSVKQVHESQEDKEWFDNLMKELEK